jgi:hypothetical protein
MSEYNNSLFDEYLFLESQNEENNFIFDSFTSSIKSLNRNGSKNGSIINTSEVNQGEIAIEISNTSTKKSSSISQFDILRKIQIHFLNFIVLFLNYILKAENIEEEYRFLFLGHGFKKIINKNNSKELQNKNLGEIIVNDISPKYKRKAKDKNQKTFDRIKENEEIKKIMSINYLDLFQKIYIKSSKKINLKEFGINKEYTLSEDVKMFKDLLHDNERYGRNYVKNIQISAKKEYQLDIIFCVEK